MSNARRDRRKQERAQEKHFNMLSSLLMDFYDFLEQSNKPTDEEVREEFIKQEQKWKQYCFKNQLTENASLLFNQEVAQSWKKRYAVKDSTTLN